MTTAEKSCRELDERIAIEVFGMWHEEDERLGRVWYGRLHSGQRVYASSALPLRLMGPSCWWSFLPKFSSDMNAAWAIIENCRTRGFAAHVGTQNNGYPWTVQFSGTGITDREDGHGDTAVLAICDAALKLAAWEADRVAPCPSRQSEECRT